MKSCPGRYQSSFSIELKAMEWLLNEFYIHLLYKISYNLVKKNTPYCI